MSQSLWDKNYREKSPLFQSLKEMKFEQWPSLQDYSILLEKEPVYNKNNLPIQFSPPARENYEGMTYLKGKIQTRPNNWHDFFNAMVWFSFPKTKALINQRHVEQQSINPGKMRSSLQNALTLFDESGAIVVSSDPMLSELLKNFKWKELFWENRQNVLSNMQCFIFGHGLLEKALNPFLGMTGQGIILPVEKNFFCRPDKRHMMDGLLEQTLATISTPADLSPVPILGFPGFSAENEQESYYDNTNYFRPGRKSA